MVLVVVGVVTPGAGAGAVEAEAGEDAAPGEGFTYPPELLGACTPFL